MAGRSGFGRLPEEIIVLRIWWYLRYCRSYCDLGEMMVERRVDVDHSTIALGRPLFAQAQPADSAGNTYSEAVGARR